MARNGIRLEIPKGGTAYEAKGDVIVVEDIQFQYRKELPDDLTGAAKGSLPGTLKANIRVGTGAGTRAFTLDFAKWEGETGQSWGTASSGDSVITKLQVLADDLARSDVDSLNVAEFQWWEYSDSGQFDPIDVSFETVTLPFEGDEFASTARPQVELVETVDIT